MITKKNYSKNLNKHTKLKLLNKAKKSDNKTQAKNIKYVKKQKHTQKAGGILQWDKVKIKYKGLIFDNTAKSSESEAKTIKFEKLYNFPKITFSDNGNYIVYVYFDYNNNNTLIGILQHIRKNIFNTETSEIQSISTTTLNTIKDKLSEKTIYKVKYTVYEIDKSSGTLSEETAKRLISSSGRPTSDFFRDIRRYNRDIRKDNSKTKMNPKLVGNYYFKVKVKK
jgi:hypothetical protein